VSYFGGDSTIFDIFTVAIINDLPANAKQDYEVLFEDSTYSSGYSDSMYVGQRFVISIKQRKS
jgi:SAGA-associated factor 29